MAEIATIARPYAEALFRAATDVGGSAGANDVSVWLDELSAIAEAPELRHIADDPRVTTDQMFAVFADVARTALPDMGKNFLRTIIENKRISAVGEVAVQFRLLMNRERGSSDALVYSAFPLDSDALTDIGELLEKRFGRKLNLSVQLDDSLIGGIRVVVGDEVLDTSVKARLEQMKAALTA